MGYLTSEVIKRSGVAFGTSGARGLVSVFSKDVCASFAVSFVEVMQRDFEFSCVSVAIDNRPSSPRIASMKSYTGERLVQFLSQSF